MSVLQFLFIEVEKYCSYELCRQKCTKFLYLVHKSTEYIFMSYYNNIMIEL